jgi:hypothetical protein
MDRRFHQRFSTDLRVVVTQLDSDSGLTGQLEDVSDSGICGLFEGALEPGAMVKLEVLGLTLYGHVVHSNPDGGSFRTGIFVEPALLDSSNITELLQPFIITNAGQL